jgi:hypothetical protein
VRPRFTEIYSDWSTCTAFPALRFFNCGGIPLMLAHPEKPDLDHPKFDLYFKVWDISQVHEVRASRGVKFSDFPRRGGNGNIRPVAWRSFKTPKETLSA